MDQREERVTVSRVADILGVHPDTVRRMDRRGELPSFRNWLGQRVFYLDTVLRVKAERERLVSKEPTQ